MSGAGLILVFARSPEPGAVKTRLERDIAAHAGADRARTLTLALYEAFVLDTVEGLRKTFGSDGPLRICFDPPGAASSMRQWLGPDLEYAPQRGVDLGARMAHAFEEAWRTPNRDVDRVVLMGSDVPDYPPELAAQALDSLRSVDAVIAPSLDGGYFLIGFRKAAYRRAFFEGVAWGEGSVCGATLAVLRAAGLRVDVLPEWNDVDHGCDAAAVLAMHRDDGFARSRTFALLKAHREIFERFCIDAALDGWPSQMSLRRRLESARESILAKIPSD